MEPLTEIEAPISKVTSEKIVLNLGDRLGIISKNDVAMDDKDKTTERFKVGDTVRAVVISEKDGFVKLSIRELYKQQRDAEIAEKERTKAIEMAAANPDNDGQARKQRISEERAKFASKAVAWFQREKQKTRKAYLKKCGMVATLVAVMVSAFLLLPPATSLQITEEDPLVRLARVRPPAVADMVNFEMAMKLSDLGLDVDLIVTDEGTMVGTREKAYSPADRDTVVKKLMAQGVKVEFVSRANVDAVEVAKEKKGTLIVFTE